MEPSGCCFFEMPSGGAFYKFHQKRHPAIRPDRDHPLRHSPVRAPQQPKPPSWHRSCQRLQKLKHITHFLLAVFVSRGQEYCSRFSAALQPTKSGSARSLHMGAGGRIPCSKTEGMCGKHEHAIYTAAMQGGHLHQGRPSAGLCGGCPRGGPGGNGVCAGGSGALPILWRCWAGGRFCHSLEVHLPHWAGHRPRGYQTGRLPRQALP